MMAHKVGRQSGKIFERGRSKDDMYTQIQASEGISVMAILLLQYQVTGVTQDTYTVNYTVKSFTFLIS